MSQKILYFDRKLVQFINKSKENNSKSVVFLNLAMLDPQISYLLRLEVNWIFKNGPSLAEGLIS